MNATPTKKELLDKRQVTSQQALVNKINPKPKTSKRFVIPGGANLFETVSRDAEDKLAELFHTWLRAAGDYSGFTFSLLEDLQARKTSSARVRDLDQIGSHPYWAQQGGKKMLAEELARLFSQNEEAVGFVVTKDTIVMHTAKNVSEKSKGWLPHFVFEVKRSTYSS